VRELGTRTAAYWVQPRPRIRNGRWSGVIYVGRSDRDIGKTFEIIALVNPQGSLPEGRSISRIPDSAARRAVTVKRGTAS